MDIQPHAFAPTPGSTRCAVPGCGSPRLAMVHAIRVDEPVPPFPAEPAFGSPDAVKRAAETIRGYAGKLAQIPSQADLLAEVERLRAEVATLKALHLQAENEVAEHREAEITTRQQRDALADALLPYAQRSRAAVNVSRGIEPSAELLAAEAALRRAGYLVAQPEARIDRAS